ncbi:hypothetical protein HBA55_28565 [Pseudomaricurvus alkylphenolicus]|uniref:alpha/beta hydrolase n=1 Tax=Pseudomaricurvus alkylphenolicus TaxID=1306991 RepID=UPI00141F7684|nr:hypothetical protein [Pseudomaricurvus alkylphenolicus]NIB43595.1 hypothetical protein [Pseudomaricurvus alkylphenolicus]
MDKIVVVLLLIAIALSSQESGLASILLAGVNAALVWRYAAQGRWQSAPIGVLSVLLLVVMLFSPGSPPASWLLVTFIVSALLASWLLWLSPIPELPNPTGRYRVGRHQIEFPGPRSPLQAYIWYPARNSREGTQHRYFTQQEAQAFSNSYRALGAPGFFDKHWQLVATHSLQNTAAQPGKFPLIVFNHGGALWPLQNTVLMEELASHGYIVCSLAHPGESGGVAWKNGSICPLDADLVARMKQQGQSNKPYANFQLCQDAEQKRGYLEELVAVNGQYTSELTQHWADDSLALVNHLKSNIANPGQGNGDLNDLAMSIDLENRAYAGMSLGGSVAHECCFRDPDAKAGINLDGMNWSYERRDKNVPTAFLQLYGDPILLVEQLKTMADPMATEPGPNCANNLMCNDFCYEAPEQRGQRADVWRIVLKGAGHMAFTDKMIASRGWLRKLWGIGPIDGESGLMSVNNLCRHFLDRYVKGIESEEVELMLNNNQVVVRQQPPVSTAGEA